MTRRILIGLLATIFSLPALASPVAAAGSYLVAGPHTIIYPTTYTAECPAPPGIFFVTFVRSAPEGAHLTPVDTFLDCAGRRWWSIDDQGHLFFVPAFEVTGPFTDPPAPATPQRHLIVKHGHWHPLTFRHHRS